MADRMDYLQQTVDMVDHVQDGVSLVDSGHQLLPAGTLQIAATGHVGISEVVSDAVLGQEQQLGVQVF